jgi:hypothetical protein
LLQGDHRIGPWLAGLRLINLWPCVQRLGDRVIAEKGEATSHVHNNPHGPHAFMENNRILDNGLNVVKVDVLTQPQNRARPTPKA